MRENWVTDKLSNCIKLKSGDGLTAKNMAQGDYPVYGGNGIAGYHSKYNLSGENIIIGRVGALCGIARYIDEEIWLTDNAFKISEFKYSLDLEFLNYLLNFVDLRSYARQAAQPVISNSSLKDVVLSFPKSLPEQKRIVSILDRAFAAIERSRNNAEQNLKNAKELFESYLQGVFDPSTRSGQINKGDDWEEKKLDDVCKVIGGGTPSKKNEDFYKGNILWASVRDMKTDIIRKTEFKITEQAVMKSSTNIIPKGNVIIATRVGLGKVCMVENNTAINQDLKGILPKNEKQLSVDFLFRWFKSISNKIIEEGTGATVQGVKLSFIKSLNISLPSIQEQKQIVTKLDALSTETKKLESIYQQKIDDLEELKKSVLHKAFNGEL